MPKSDIPIDVLIYQLHGADWPARCEAARLLGQSGDRRAVEALLPDLRDLDWRVRRNAAQALGALRDKRALEPLLETLKDRTLTVRQRAIVALGRIKDQQALPALIDILLEGKRESYDASKAVQKFGKKALPELVKAYESNHDLKLLLLLVELKYPQAFELLIEALNYKEPAVKLVVLRELGKLRDQRASPYLMNELHGQDPILRTEVVDALGKLGATESIPLMLGMLKDDEIYGPQGGLYRAITNAFQVFGGITDEISNAFPGNYPAMLNMGGAPISLPEVMGMLGNGQANILSDAISRIQTGYNKADNIPEPVAGAVDKAMEDMAWKFGVMFADAKDAKQERVTRLIELLRSENSLTRSAAALSLAWYGNERALGPLQKRTTDPDETTRITATWAVSALQKAIFYRNQLGM
jgi:HEAT repeat protein